MADINTLHQDLTEVLQAIKKLSGESGTTPGTGSGGSIKDALGKRAGAMGRKGIQDYSVAGMMQAGKGAAMGGINSALGGAVPILGPMIAIGKELAHLPERIRKFADGLHQANRAFASVSPSMSLVMMQSDFQEMMRNMRKGEAIAGSAGALAEARNKLENQLAPVDVGKQNLMNEAGALLSSAMGNFLEKSDWGKQLGNLFGEGAGALKQLREKMDGEDQVREDAWIKELEQLERDEERKRALRMQPVKHVPGRDPRPNFVHDRRDPGGV